MNADKRRCPDSLTEVVIGAIVEVSNVLGAGFLEKVYQRALLKELSLRGVRVTAEVPLTVYYKGDSVGEYYADIVAEDVLIIELKCAEHLADEHMAQCLNYLRGSGYSVCLLVNFQRRKAEWRRIVYGHEPTETS